MIVTEAEALEKGCTIQTGTEDVFCGASACMAWRWVETRVVDEAFTEAVKRVAAETNDTDPSRKKSVREVADNREKHGLPVVPTRGYCGLAGVPHDLPAVIR